MGNLNSIYVFGIPACADFYRYRLGSILYGGGYNIVSQVGIFHKSGALSVFYYFRNGAAHVYVKDYVLAGVKLPGGKTHYFRLVSEKLVCCGTFSVKDFK